MDWINAWAMKSSVYFRTFLYFCSGVIYQIPVFHSSHNHIKMRILGKKLLLKLQVKNKGNRKLWDAIDKLLEDLEQFNPRSSKLTEVRKDADCVHSDGFYFLNIHVHRTFILVDFDEEGQATII
ncbi:hypothetical protein SAMN05444266_10625 [Chitinophaga jiangningensis]|uniref:Uncharacterized protein n=1 Tax=Chitinophaga jiangningensis TaxID=1419482 RepID=A0A1M7F7M7_9BACT|nr:hypothetical protein [Chitinophaga jiangningensis]SHM00000.1 hypothetical protein SAMN05444266_10625 [Chitinophaga jiangningensis]